MWDKRLCQYIAMDDSVFTPAASLRGPSSDLSVAVTASAEAEAGRLELAFEFSAVIAMLVGGQLASSDIHIDPLEESQPEDALQRRFEVRFMADEPVDPEIKERAARVVTALAGRALANAESGITVEASVIGGEQS